MKNNSNHDWLLIFSISALIIGAFFNLLAIILRLILMFV